MEEAECGRRACQALHKKEMQGKVISVCESKNTEGPNIATTKLSVKNLPFGCTPQRVRSLFQKYGLILECEVLKTDAVVVSYHNHKSSLHLLGSTAFQMTTKVPIDTYIYKLCSKRGASFRIRIPLDIDFFLKRLFRSGQLPHLMITSYTHSKTLIFERKVIILSIQFRYYCEGKKNLHLVILSLR
jgi:hypothetical protein